MSNSPLVNYTKISPNKNSPRNNTIKKITIHHMAGNASIETCGALFANPNRKASSNYGIGSDGRVGLYVDEKDRSWCSSSGSNDHQAITIEVANDGGAPLWHVSDKALAKCIELCVDICKRNGIKKLNYTGDVSGNLTLHKWFAATACPGPYLESKMPYIADEVNKRLAPATKPATSTTTTASGKIKAGDVVKITGNKYYYGAVIPNWVRSRNWIVHSVSGDKVVINQDTAKKYAIMSPVRMSAVALVSSAKSGTKTYKKGDAVQLKSAPLYKSASAASPSSRMTGTYYVYDGEKINGRYRITTSKARVGKKPAAFNVTGWVEL